jgi:hypothetical protein
MTIRSKNELIGEAFFANSELRSLTAAVEKYERQLKIYRDALSNIAKTSGKCWENGRVCYDDSFVAHEALERAEPEYFADIEPVKYTEFYVKRDGSFHRKKTKISVAKMRDLADEGLKLRRELEKRIAPMKGS